MKSIILVVIPLSILILLVSCGKQKAGWKGTIEEENGVKAIISPLLACNVFQKNKGKYLIEVNYVGSLRIVMSFRNGLVIAADGKGSVINLDDLKNGSLEKLDRRLLYHRKLFKLGINLVAAYGGQLIKTQDYFLPSEGFNQEFMNWYSFDVNGTLEIDEVAKKLFENLRFRYYSQPIENQFRESSIIFGWVLRELSQSMSYCSK